MIRRFLVATAMKITNARSTEQQAAKISTVAHLGIALIDIVEM